MEVFTGMTSYDLVIVGLFVLLVGRGIWLGLLRQVTGFFALYLGYLAASRYHDRILPVLRDISENPKVVFLTSYVILFIATYVVVMLLGKALGYVLQLTITSWFDRILGGVIGFAKAIILAVLLHMILGTVLVPESQMLRTCITCDTLNQAAGFTRDLITNEETRKSLLQQRPAIAIDAVKDYLAPAGVSGVGGAGGAGAGDASKPHQK
jgi:membrane protein required for colicin V production